MKTVRELKEIAIERSAEYRLKKTQLVQEEEALNNIIQSIKDLEEAKALVLEIAHSIQETIHKQISAIVSRCLETVFEEPYTFKIIFEQKRGQIEANLVFERDGVVVDPLTASGGGVVDVAAFALRLACLGLSTPKKAPILILDEPFKFVSAGNLARVRQLLESLSEEMNIQILMVTHLDELKIGKVIEL